MRTTNALIIVFVCIVALWLFRSATSACHPRDLALVHTESTFMRADSNADGQLSRTEFAVAAAELSAGFAAAASRAESLRGVELPAGERPAGERPAAGALLAPVLAGPVSPAAPSSLPQCSILVFWHVVKTAGTTMRTVLQRQAQFGEFECVAATRGPHPMGPHPTPHAPAVRMRHALCLSTATLAIPRAPRYIYSDTVTKPRWQLIMHQLSQATRLPRLPHTASPTAPPPHHLPHCLPQARVHTLPHRHTTATATPGAPHREIAHGRPPPSALWPHAPRRASPCAQRVAPRRIIIELHSEWGLPTSFFADVAQLRALYAPLGCRVTLGTVLRHPVAWYLSLFNWRASNAIPLCQWQLPSDGISRQVGGHAEAATMRTRGCSRAC